MSGKNFSSYPAFSRSQHANVARFARCDDTFLLDVVHDHIPDRWAFGAFIHAGPARDHIVVAWIEWPAGLKRRQIRDTTTGALAHIDCVGQAADADHVAALLIIGIGVEQIVGD